MEIHVVNNEICDFSKVLPSFLLDISKRPEEIIIVAIEDGILLGFAMFGIAPLWSHVINLDFIYTDRAARDKKVASKILAYAEHFFKSFGIRSISMKTCGTSAFLKSSFDFLVAEQFYPIALDGHLLEYRLSDIRESNFAKKINTMEPFFKNIVKAKDVPKSLLLDMLKYSENAKEEVDKRGYDLEHSYFYVSDNKIVGSIFTELPDDKTIFCVGGFLSEDANNKIVMPTLIGALIKGWAGFDKNTRILVQCFIEGDYKGIITQFGTPLTEYRVQEYLKHWMSLEQDRSLEGEEALSIPQIKERIEYFDGEFTIPMPTEESYRIYEKYIPKGELYDKCLKRYGFMFISEYGLRRARLLAYMDLGVPIEFTMKQVAEEYKAEVVKWYKTIDKEIPIGAKRFSFFRKKAPYESSSIKELEQYINEIDIPWNKGTLIFYYLQQLYDCYFTDIVYQYRDVLPKVSKVARNNSMIKDFQAIAAANNIGFDTDTYDDEISYFYIEKNEIVAAVWTERLVSGVMVVHEPYINDKCKNKLVPLALLWEVLQTTKNELGEETKIGFEAANENGIIRTQMYFGKGYRQLSIYDDITPEGIRIARVTELYREPSELIEWDTLSKMSLSKIKELAREYDDKAIISYHKLIEGLDNADARELAVRYYEKHRGLRYTKTDNNRKKIVKRMMELLK